MIAGGECAECQKKKSPLKRRSAIQSEPAEVPPIIHEVLQSPGQLLDHQTRSFMESRFGHDFSQVRVHNNTQAAESAATVNAVAYTVGRDVIFGEGQYMPGTTKGQRLLAHELTHVVQQGSQKVQRRNLLTISRPSDTSEIQADTVAQYIARDLPLPLNSIKRLNKNILQRQTFKPWPGQNGTDVPRTLTKKGDIIREQVQRKGDPLFAQPGPILLEFNQAQCTLTSTMAINFTHPKDKKVRLTSKKFDNLKTKILQVANKRLNGWITLSVGSDKACTLPCRGKEIKVTVVAREGKSANAAEVELRSDTGRSNEAQIFAGGDDWFTALLGGVSGGTLWHEAGHIVLGLPDEYAARASVPELKGRAAGERSHVNESDWSAMASHSSFGRRAVLHPRHFSFMPAWLGRKFPKCRFSIKAAPRPVVIDVVIGLDLAFTGKFGGVWSLGQGLELAAGFPLNRLRRWRLLVGGYGAYLGQLEPPKRKAFLVGALVGLSYSTNRSAGGFGLRGDLRLGGAFGKAVDPSGALTTSGRLQLGYAGPWFEFGAFGEVGAAIIGGSPKLREDPYFQLGLQLGITF
ncbi:MAG: DUF4157 domain-containing protein [Synechococcus sp.]